MQVAYINYTKKIMLDHKIHFIISLVYYLLHHQANCYKNWL